MEQEWTWVYLLAGTVTFISVFIQITLRIGPFQRILKKQAGRTDRIIVILVFGGFSILGTYMGIPLTSGAIGNVRDLGPIIAGLVGGPLLGLGAGLIGVIHRYFLGGLTRISCALATIIIGLMSGFIHKLNRGEIAQARLGYLVYCTYGMFPYGVDITHSPAFR